MKDLIGAKIIKIRPMTDEELQREGWERDQIPPATVVEFDTGDVLYASCDEEGNNYGCLFGYSRKEEKPFLLMAEHHAG